MSEPLLMRRQLRRDGVPLLVPVTPQAAGALDAIAPEEVVAIKLVRDRSLPQHRLFFGLLDHVAKASKFETAEILLVALKMRLGRYDLLKLPNGQVVPVPQSISFAKMAADDFQKFFDDSVRLICEEVIPGANGDDLIREVQLMLQPRNSAGGPPDRGGEGVKAETHQPSPHTPLKEPVDG